MLWRDLLAGIGMGLVLPGIILNFGVMLLSHPLPDPEPALVSEVMAEEKPVIASSENNKEPISIALRNAEGEIQKVDLESYLVGVVLAEMPHWFETEALKAQAVVARTYTLKAYASGGKHGDGSICTQSDCCQAYIPEEAFVQQGGSVGSLDKVRSAVKDTEGMVLYFNGELIDATYFSCSGGRTEAAQAVWGTDYPYLQAVDSPGEEKASHFTDTEFIAAEVFCDALGVYPSGAPDRWIGTVQYTDGNGIAAMEIGGVQYTGVELRQKLGLRSTAISMEARENGFLVTTKGFGHRVGMSQYGADAMAAQGNLYPQILSYYYLGTTLEMWSEQSK